MTGLQIEIEKRKVKGVSPYLEPISVGGIATLLNITYNGAKRKLKYNYFTIDEATKILENFFKVSDKYESLKYLFIEQGE